MRTALRFRTSFSCSTLLPRPMAFNFSASIILLFPSITSMKSPTMSLNCFVLLRNSLHSSCIDVALLRTSGFITWRPSRSA